MKKVFIIVTFIFISIFNVYAQENNYIEDIYNDQIKISGANDIIDALPKETHESLNDLGIDKIDWDMFSELTAEKIFSEIFDIAKKQSYAPLSSITAVIGIMLLYALLDSMKLSFESKSLTGVMGAVSALCICSIIVLPIVKCIGRASIVISNSAKFMFCYIPIMSGLMISSGQVVSGTSYYFLMVSVGEVIAQLSSGILAPLLNIFLALSVISSISPKIGFAGLCEFINQAVKWVLGFVMSLFTGFLTIKSIVATAADNTSTKTAKMFISSFIPIVGGALSDAFNTVQSCVKLLKSSVGAFAILAAGFIFIPILLECLIWLLSLGLCNSIGDVLNLTKICSLLKSSSKVMSTMLVIIICCMTILIISTVIVLVMGCGS